MDRQTLALADEISHWSLVSAVSLNRLEDTDDRRGVPVTADDGSDLAGPVSDHGA